MNNNNIIDVSESDFELKVLEGSVNKLVVVDFWAPWCGPCKQLTPIIEKVVTEARGKVKLVKLNIDDHPDTPGKYGVRGIPTMILFKDGQPVETKVGAAPKAQIKSWLESSL